MASIRLFTTSRHLLPSLCSRHFHAQAENVYRQRHESGTACHPFEHMYPWKSLEQFVDRLEDGILFMDDNIIAMDKPWGVGIHHSQPTIKRQNSYLVDTLSFGNPRFCVDDALPLLCERLRTKELAVKRSIDRFESGIILLAKNDVGTKVIGKISRLYKPRLIPFAKFWCITKGYPVIPGNFISEQITLKKIDVDELADYKEPIIVNKRSFTNRFRKDHEHDFTAGAVEMRVLETNQEYAVSLVEINTNQTKFNFVRCYAASKTSFILGDTRFAKRVRHVLGQPITLAPPVVPNNHYEPLSFPLRKRLLIPQNSAVPLMIHLKSIKIPKYGPKRSDLEITTRKLPEHFDWSLYRLFLGNSREEHRETNFKSK